MTDEVEATGRDSDHADYWRRRPLEAALDAQTAVQVVSKRCVYLNDYRIAGSKPYYSENLPNQRFKTTIRAALDAFSDDILRSALREREAVRKHNARWQAARAALEKHHD